eukprot:1405098-Pyramimonas_sp.AAC.1
MWPRRGWWPQRRCTRRSSTSAGRESRLRRATGERTTRAEVEATVVEVVEGEAVAARPPTPSMNRGSRRAPTSLPSGRGARQRSGCPECVTICTPRCSR